MCGDLSWLYSASGWLYVVICLVVQCLRLAVCGDLSGCIVLEVGPCVVICPGCIVLEGWPCVVICPGCIVLEVGRVW